MDDRTRIGPAAKAPANKPTEGAQKLAEQLTDEPITSEWPVRIKLNKPIRDKDANFVDFIEFREPTGADIIACGVPAVPNYETGTITLDGQRMSAMMSRLSQVPMPFIAQMSAVDWATCATKLQRHFLPDLERLLT
jgi:hypothetical protein